MEEWLAVSGFPNAEVSNLGRIRSLFRGKSVIRKPLVHQHGYLTITLQNKTLKKRARIHVLVAEAFLGPKPKGFDVNHKDGNKKNNVADNLEYLTRSDNCKHAFKIGLSYTPFRERGEKHPTAKISDADARAIRKMYRNGISRRAIGEKYGISYYTVWDITAGRRWTHTG
jgi:hypothetical protein